MKNIFAAECFGTQGEILGGFSRKVKKGASSGTVFHSVASAGIVGKKFSQTDVP